MGSITKVVLAGATGNLGPAILNQLLAAGFHVTALTRTSSAHTFPPSVTSSPVDYDSLTSLTDALRGHDALVSTLGSTALSKQLLLIEAASKAGIKRFIPSEFGSDTLNEKASKLPVYGDKVAVQDALKKEAERAGMTYTLVMNGPFLDWGIMVGFIMNLKGKSVTLFDGGDRVFSTTTLASIGKAVVGVLKNPAETKNRAVYVQDTAVSLKKLAAMGKKATGGEGWQEEVIKIDDVLAQSWAELQKESPKVEIFVYGFLKAAIWGEGYGSHFPKLDNELLGVKGLSDAEVQDVVSQYA